MLEKIYKYNNYDLEKREFTGIAKEPIVFKNSFSDPDYTQQTTIIGIYNTVIFTTKDNLYIQDKVREAFSLTSWSIMTDEEKDILITVSVGKVDQEKIAYLQSKGYTQEQAIELLKVKWVENYEKNKKACKRRLNSRSINNVLAKYLKTEDAEDLAHTVSDLLDDYLLGIRGVVHQGETYGLLDYYNSTAGTPYENQGLKETKSYIMQNGDVDMTNFINDTLNILLYGNY